MQVNFCQSKFILCIRLDEVLKTKKVYFFLKELLMLFIVCIIILRNDICTTIFNNFYDNFLFHTHIIFLFFLFCFSFHVNT